MVRVPNTETSEQEAKRFLDSFDRQIAGIEQRDYIYAWSTDPDAVADDAIIVGIGGTSVDLPIGGLM